LQFVTTLLTRQAMDAIYTGGRCARYTPAAAVHDIQRRPLYTIYTGGRCTRYTPAAAAAAVHLQRRLQFVDARSL
jgi:hypothetical protein